MIQKLIIDFAKLRDMWAAGDRVRDIAVVLGCSPQYVSKLAARIGLPRRLMKQGVLPAAWIEAVYRDGWTTAEICDALRKTVAPTLSRTTVGTVLHSRGVQMRPPRVRMRVSPEECVRLLKQGYSRKDIAKMMRLSEFQVNHRIAKKLGRGRRGGQRPRVYDYDEIQRMLREGHSHRAVAARIGCSKPTVDKAAKLARRQVAL